MVQRERCDPMTTFASKKSGRRVCIRFRSFVKYATTSQNWFIFSTSSACLETLYRYLLVLSCTFCSNSFESERLQLFTALFFQTCFQRTLSQSFSRLLRGFHLS